MDNGWYLSLLKEVHLIKLIFMYDILKGTNQPYLKRGCHFGQQLDAVVVNGRHSNIYIEVHLHRYDLWS